MMATVGDGQLYYLTLGAGQPLLIMHGGLGLDHTCFRPWLDPLGDHATVIYYDHRGNGRSSRPDRFEALGFDTWAADADRLRAHLGYDRIVLFGHSMGGCIAQEYALRYPDRLAGLILCDTFPAFDHLDVALGNARARGTPSQFEALQRALGEPTNDDRRFSESWSAILPLYFHRPDAWDLDPLFAKTRFSAPACYRSFECLGAFNVTSRLREIRVPTLILNGIDDWAAPVEEVARRLQAGIRGSELVIFEQSGHWPFIEEPERFVRVVSDWLANLP